MRIETAERKLRELRKRTGRKRGWAIHQSHQGERLQRMSIILNRPINEVVRVSPEESEYFQKVLWKEIDKLEKKREELP